MNEQELHLRLKDWLASQTHAREAADWLLGLAERNGQLPKETTLLVDSPMCPAVEDLFSGSYVRYPRAGTKVTIQIARMEMEMLGASGVLLPTLAAVCNRPLVNRSADRESRRSAIEVVLNAYVAGGCLPGFVARRELEKIQKFQGRFWNRYKDSSVTEIQSNLSLYMRLLVQADKIHRDATRIEPIVHVSRKVAGDTHWLRPSNQVWRDLADDILQCDESLASLNAELDETHRRSCALAEWGLSENLTSVAVLVFGTFSICRGESRWNWHADAARECLPVWFSALHLENAKIESHHPIAQVITVENETSFWDLLYCHKDAAGVALIYTEGQANRAVLRILRLLYEAFPSASFLHQGDLDLPGIRILASLQKRTHIPIQPMFMDAATHRQHEAQGIVLSDAERNEAKAEIQKGLLPCLDLVESICQSGKRIEQESITRALRK